MTAGVPRVGKGKEKKDSHGVRTRPRDPVGRWSLPCRCGRGGRDDGSQREDKVREMDGGGWGSVPIRTSIQHHTRSSPYPLKTFVPTPPVSGAHWVIPRSAPPGALTPLPPYCSTIPGRCPLFNARFSVDRGLVRKESMETSVRLPFSGPSPPFPFFEGSGKNLLSLIGSEFPSQSLIRSP